MVRSPGLKSDKHTKAASGGKAAAVENALTRTQVWASYATPAYNPETDSVTMDPMRGVIQRWEAHEGHHFTKPYRYRHRRTDGKKPPSVWWA